MSNQDEPGQQPEPGQRPEDQPGSVPPPGNPYGGAEPSSYGTPSTPTPYGEPPAPPTQPYAQQPPPYGSYDEGSHGQGSYAQGSYAQDPYAQPGQYGQQPAQYGGYSQPGYGPVGYGAPPAHPSATTALVLGLVSLIGLFICLVPIVAAPFAWRTGSRVVREIDAQPGRWSGREQAQAGRIMGMIGTVILVLGVLAIVGLVVLLFAASSSYEGPVVTPNGNV